MREGKPGGVSLRYRVLSMERSAFSVRRPGSSATSQRIFSGGAQQSVPLDLQADDIDDLVRQACYVLVAEVDGDAGLLLLQFPGSIWATVADVLA